MLLIIQAKIATIQHRKIVSRRYTRDHDCSSFFYKEKVRKYLCVFHRNKNLTWKVPKKKLTAIHNTEIPINEIMKITAGRIFWDDCQNLMTSLKYELQHSKAIVTAINTQQISFDITNLIPERKFVMKKVLKITNFLMAPYF